MIFGINGIKQLQGNEFYSQNQFMVGHSLLTFSPIVWPNENVINSTFDFETEYYWIFINQIRLKNEEGDVIHTEDFDALPSLLDTASTYVSVPPIFFVHLNQQTECGMHTGLSLEFVYDDDGTSREFVIP